MTNFPFGENIWNPVNITNQAAITPYWAISKIVGPVCGYNVFVIMGLTATAMSAFYLISWLTRRTDVSLLGGYMIAFNPYLQVKTGAHMNYALSGIFCLLFWQYFRILKNPTISNGALMGLLLAISCYINGYFILISIVLLFSLLLGTFIYKLAYKWKSAFVTSKQAIKVAGAALLIAMLCTSPIIFLQANDSGKIQKSLKTSRGDITQESSILAARPIEYILPSDSHPVFNNFVREHTNGAIRGSNNTEYTLYIGWVGILLALLFITGSIKQYKSYKLPSMDNRLLLLTTISCAAVAFLISLPPVIRLGTHNITGLSGYILDITSYWRAFGRLQLLVVLSVVVLAMCGLSGLTSKYSKTKRYTVILTCFILVFFEYLTFWPISQSWSYDSVPQVYKRLAARNEVHAIAEYPLEEAPFPPTTLVFTYQQVHQKPVLNSYLSSSTSSSVRAAVSDLTNSETANILRGLGIDAITVHSQSQPLSIASNFKLIDHSYDSLDHKNIYLYMVRGGKNAEYILLPGRGTTELFRTQSFPKMAYIIKKTGEFNLLRINKDIRASKDNKVKLTITLMPTTSNSSFVIDQNNQHLAEGYINSSSVYSFYAKVDKPIIVKVISGSTLQAKDIAIGH